MMDDKVTQLRGVFFYVGGRLCYLCVTKSLRRIWDFVGPCRIEGSWDFFCVFCVNDPQLQYKLQAGAGTRI